MNAKLFDNLKENLKLLFPDYQISGDGKEFRINCPICLREGRVDRGYHMYINIDPSKPPMFNCFRNIRHRGIIDQDFLETYSELPQYVDTELLSEIRNQTNKAYKLNRYRLNKDNSYTLYPPMPINNKRSLLKLAYINNRLGTHLTLEDLPRLKIITDVMQFIQFNHIETVTRHPFILQGLDEYFVGFLSNNNASINLRKIPNQPLPEEYKSIDQRYIKYKTISKDTFSGYYIIPTQCDILYPIRINIAEGQFDILSVYLNLFNGNTINNIFVSIGSNSYIKTMQYFIENYGLIDVEFHLYIDNDIPKETLPDIREVFKNTLGYRIFVHMNMTQGEKDFGVPKEKIMEYVYEL